MSFELISEFVDSSKGRINGISMIVFRYFDISDGFRIENRQIRQEQTDDSNLKNFEEQLYYQGQTDRQNLKTDRGLLMR